MKKDIESLLKEKEWWKKWIFPVLFKLKDNKEKWRKSKINND